ncbi:hypothetical protein DFH11DRAFT_1582254 [Phellopilus nigrolimitatus]|nr:hypothetical protein DFH11DRAFT_1670044 [Phellopilus nigrolimitatus]KAH8116674.1 hypothetical protein DFH11DRAFT_1582254 [Phellopilus nigrolimitatus]
MSGFEFGSEDGIEHKLVDILKSGAYACAVQVWERRRAPGRNSRGGLQCIPRVL